MTSSFSGLSTWEQGFSGTGLSAAGSALVGWLCHVLQYRQLGQRWLKDTHVPCSRCVTSHCFWHTGHVWKRSFRQLSDTMYLTSWHSVVESSLWEKWKRERKKKFNESLVKIIKFDIKVHVKCFQMWFGATSIKFDWLMASVNPSMNQ